MPSPQFQSACRRQCRSLQSRLDQGGVVTSRDHLQLATATVGELRSRAGVPDAELLAILYFLLTQRVSLERHAEKTYAEAVDVIARNLAPRISKDGDMTWNPFEGKKTPGRKVLSRFYQASLNVGQAEASLAFA